MRAFAHHHFPPSFLWGAALPGTPEETGLFNLASDGWVSNLKSKSGESSLQRKFWLNLLDQASDSSLTSIRIHLDWRVLQPQQNKWNNQAIEFYNFLFAEMEKRDLRLVLTMMSGSPPAWFIKQGGWYEETCIQWFSQYTEKVVSSFGKYVDFWITLEDPIQTAMMFLGNDGSVTGKKSGELLLVLHNLMKAHKAAYKNIRREKSDGYISYANWYWPAFFRRSENNKAGLTQNTLGKFHQFYEKGIIEFKQGKLEIPDLVQLRDYVALGFLRMAVVTPSGFIQPGSQMDLKHWDNDSVAAMETEGIDQLIAALKWARQLSLPIYITRHQILLSDAAVRKRIIFKTIRTLWNFVNESWPIRGYFYHSLIDGNDFDSELINFTGCLDMNEETGEVVRRLSGELYSEICRMQGINSDLTISFVPELYSEYFPGIGPRDLSMQMPEMEL